MKRWAWDFSNVNFVKLLTKHIRYFLIFIKKNQETLFPVFITFLSFVLDQPTHDEGFVEMTFLLSQLPGIPQIATESSS